jgi:threonine aldolase
MREAMLRAEVGADVVGEDPTVTALEERLAALFGHEAGLFCPSGTMTNQIAVHVHTRPGDEVILDEGGHIYRYEGAGVMATSGCSVKLIHGDRGRFTAAQVEACIHRPEADWLARTRMVYLENTTNRGGGAVWELAEVEHIRRVCDGHGLALHLDGARIFNALVATGTDARTWGSPFHSVSICLSKGLGAPVGSVLVGGRDFIREARRVRKRLGGGMRQVGILAAACHHALDHHVERLAEDHARARRLEEALRAHPVVEDVLPVVTNIIIVTLRPHMPAARFIEALRSEGVLVAAFGTHMVRLVTHLDIDDQTIAHACAALDNLRA